MPVLLASSLPKEQKRAGVKYYVWELGKWYEAAVADLLFCGVLKGLTGSWLVSRLQMGIPGKSKSTLIVFAFLKKKFKRRKSTE